MSQDEYDRLHVAVENARNSSKEARHDFESHLNEHHCTPEEKEPN